MKQDSIFLLVICIQCICIVYSGWYVGYAIDESIQDYARYLDTCRKGLDGLSNDDIVFCHQYDISMRTTR